MTALSELLKKSEGIKGYVLAQLTDELIFECWPEAEDALIAKETKVLDIRVFSTEYELHIFRGDVSKEFGVREIKETSDKPEDSFDRFYYIDYDEKKSKAAGDGIAYTTGGGRYHLPVEKYQYWAFRIRNYIDYYKETGSAYIKDWRLVGIEKRGEK